MKHPVLSVKKGHRIYDDAQEGEDQHRPVERAHGKARASAQRPAISSASTTRISA